MTEIDEGSLAAQVRGIRTIEATHIRDRVRSALQMEVTETRRSSWFVLDGRRRLLVAMIAAIASASIGTVGIAVTSLNHHAVVHSIPMSPGTATGLPGHLGYPGHALKTTVEEAGRLAGFRVRTLGSTENVTLTAVTYLPPFIVDGQPALERGGAVRLDYVVDSTYLEITEALDPNPSAPFDYNQKVPPGSSAAQCSTVETIGGNEYVVVRCPDGTAINSVFWKTLDGVDIGLFAVLSTSDNAESSRPELPLDVVRVVIKDLK